MGASKIIMASAVAFGLALAGPAAAGFVDIGGGWQAEWDDSLDPFVDVDNTGLTAEAVFIRKTAEFTQGSENGVFPSISILFRQMSPTAVGNIVIDDEVILNSTGEDWGGFNMSLLDSGNAIYDPVATANSGGTGPVGFSIDPFTEAAFTEDLMRLAISGGTIAAGESWFPGNGDNDGQLWIDVETTGSTVFTLTETPLVPAPGALALLLVGGLGARRRRLG